MRKRFTEAAIDTLEKLYWDALEAEHEVYHAPHPSSASVQATELLHDIGTAAWWLRLQNVPCPESDRGHARTGRKSDG